MALAWTALACWGRAPQACKTTGPELLTPRTADWQQLLASGHDERWILPFGPTRRGLCLRRATSALLAARSKVDGIGFGDLLAEFLELRSAPQAREQRLTQLAEGHPALWKQVGTALSTLVREEAWSKKSKWEPSKKNQRDGMWIGPTWDLDDESLPFWKRLGGRHQVQQVATLIWADSLAIKTTENDYAALVRDKPKGYERLVVVADQLLAGTDAEGKPFRSLTLDFRRDLPFPFTGYDCKLRILTRPGPQGTLTTDVYSKEGDFHWLAGRDVLFPVHTTEGVFVATILVRAYGFDLRRVPDKAKHVRSALKASLGGLKRRSEARALSWSKDPDLAAKQQLPDSDPAWPEPLVSTPKK